MFVDVQYILHETGEVVDGFHKFQWHEELGKDTVTEVSNLGDKYLETNEPLSSFSLSSNEEDDGSGASAYSYLSPEYFEVDFPRRTLVPFEDVSSSYLDRYPRKQVPLGADHQANIPLWGEHINNKKLDLTENCNSSPSDGGSSEEKLMGTCVIPLPDMSTDKGYYAGCGRTACDCLDSGSVRCVRQHVNEAREELRKTLGHDKFVNLGFSDMGEEVAHKWTEEEEEIFHEVVYSNPVSLCRNFWKKLSLVFPSRSKKELVSYYFNVFMLWRRAAQNRSTFLDIDTNMSSSCGSVNNGAALQARGINSEHGKRSEADWCSDVGQFYLLEPCDAKVWDARCTSTSLKNFDILSPWNMIKEDFGEGTLDNKKRDD
ncbi:at-rich interactive domain-containing protein 2 [Quercus suber]|uniref:At-rich interactive domain-containing protein 2 n=1 Tax=Quercus suber TaxID=58331 RepID=A0AAW0KEA5_QUESU